MKNEHLFLQTKSHYSLSSKSHTANHAPQIKKKKSSPVQIKLVPIYLLETVGDQFTSTNVPSSRNTEQFPMHL